MTKGQVVLFYFLIWNIYKRLYRPVKPNAQMPKKVHKKMTCQIYNAITGPPRNANCEWRNTEENENRQKYWQMRRKVNERIRRMKMRKANKKQEMRRK